VLAPREKNRIEDRGICRVEKLTSELTLINRKKKKNA